MQRPLSCRLLALLLMGVGVFGCGQSEGEPGPSVARRGPGNLVLISLDTLRPDLLGCYGYLRPSSPNLDQLAEAGVLFETATSVAPWTLPAHGSLLTGLYPRHHGAVRATQKLDPGVRNLAERLRGVGFATAAVVNSLFLKQAYGFDRGFDRFTLLRPTHAPERALDVVDEALDWLAEERANRFFLFVHDYQAHSNYTAAPDFRDQFAKPYSGPVDGTTRQLKQVRQGELVLGERDLEHLIDLYVAGVRQADENVGRLVRGLTELGLMEDTLVVVTSDHGEEFLEHGGVLHGRTQHEELLRVPLIMRGPGLPEGRRVEVPVSIIDVVPTVLGLLGIEPEGAFDGIDLGPLWRSGTGDEAVARALFGEADHHNEKDDITRSVRLGDYKLLHNRLDGSFQLYDLSSDPGEQEDLVARLPEVSARLEQRLADFGLEPVSGESRPPLSAQEIEQLKALGYLEDEPPPPR